jgi:carboxypeptidase family protein
VRAAPLRPIVCLAAAVALAACARGTELVSAPEETGRIVGRVVDSRGAPVPDVTITTTPFVPTVTTDATGHFELAGLALDRAYSVRASKTGYLSSALDVPVTRSQSFIGIELTILRLAGF